jgi:hypothetical protein
VGVEVTDNELKVAVQLEDIWPHVIESRYGASSIPLGTAQYALEINHQVIVVRNGDERFAIDGSANTITITLDRQEMAADAYKAIMAPYDVRFQAYQFAGPSGTQGGDYAPDLDLAPLRAGPEIAAAVAQYVLLSAPGAEDVAVPLLADGSWSGNLDLGLLPALVLTNVSATWHSILGTVIDSDRISLLVDPAVPVDLDAVETALSGPGSLGLSLDGEVVEQNTPGFTLIAGIAILGAAVALIRRRQ